MLILIILLVFFMFFLKFKIEIYEAIKDRFKELESLEECMILINDDYLNYMNKVIRLSDIYYNSELDDDPDVFGESWDIRFDCEVFGKNVSIHAATCYFYYDKQYKNKMEYVWLEQSKDQKLNFLERLVQNSMRATLRNQLKKRSLDSAKLIFR